jgi:triosephosphate isomerase (TIM)
MKKTALVIGNWKLNPSSLNEATKLISDVAKKYKNDESVVAAVAPTFLHLSEVAKKIGRKQISLAAQNVSTEPMGPFTGEVSAMQLRDMKVPYVIIGHSERRAMGETDEVVQRKIQIALKHNLTPVICIGERDRDAKGDFYTFVEKQVKAIAAVLPAAQVKKVVIAYEPIWAIGTGKTATAADVKEMQLFLFSTLTKLYDRATAAKVTLLYGGMNGFLVGGASLKADDFISIINATKR